MGKHGEQITGYMDPLYDIQFGFANLRKNPQQGVSYLPILREQKNHGTWVYRKDDCYGVAVEMPDDRVITESFATARMETRTDLIGGVNHNLLFLENNVEPLRNEFATICADFCRLGQDGALRDELCKDPAGWWKRWKKLMGNSVQDKAPYSVLGELLVYLKLLEDDAVGLFWQGPDQKSHDIETSSIDYEVKSTIVRYETSITVSGQYQLEASQGKTLKLLFCRFEGVKSGGHSINTVVRELSRYDIDLGDLESKLSKTGFKKGCSDRARHFVLHDAIRAYAVDKSFPKITGKSFKEGKIPKGIIQVTYRLDLSGVDSEIFMP